MTMIRGTLLPIAWLVLCLAPLGQAQTRRLWVLKAPNEIVEYDPATFAPRQPLTIPPEVVRSPQNLAINHKGQMLFLPPVGVGGADVDYSAVGDLWFWDGQKATALKRGTRQLRAPMGDTLMVTEAAPSCFLSADGGRLLWFENQFKKTQDKGGLDLSVVTRVRIWQTDLSGEKREVLADLSYPSCQCGTAACSETCPEADFWTPEGGVSNFFVLTRWVPGQIGSTYDSSFLYQKSDGTWTETKLSHPMERILDAAEGGAILIEAVPDGGCCGWENESNDQTLLNRSGKTTVLFDERSRYNNPNYDVSFFTAKAKLSPDLSFAALAIFSTAKPGGVIQLADEGQPNPDESARVRKAVADLPAVEVVTAADPPKRAAFLPHATLVGWLSNEEILVVEDHVLVAFNVVTGARRKSQIKLADEAYAFLR